MLLIFSLFSSCFFLTYTNGDKEFCNMTSCINFKNFTYIEAEDLLTCECFPGYDGGCCQNFTQCAYGDYNVTSGICDCWDPHYSDVRCDMISCDNNGEFVSEERRASPTATGCTCYPGNYGDFCELGDVHLQAAARVRITTTSRTSSFGRSSSSISSSNWRRSSSSPYYHNTYVYGTHGHRYGFDPNYLWLLVLIAMLACLSYSAYRHYKMNCVNSGETETVTKTVVELEMTDEEAQDLLQHPEKAAFYTAKYHHPPPGNTTTTTQVEVWRD